MSCGLAENGIATIAGEILSDGENAAVKIAQNTKRPFLNGMG